MLSRFAVALVCMVPCVALAAGSDDTEPPKQTKTTTQCKKGKIWDEKTAACVNPKESRLNDDLRFDAVRELAYDGKLDEALHVLASMADQTEDRVLTYKGFINRKAGRIEEGMAFYEEALKRNPDNLLARSYMGQGFVEQGEIELAQAQLAEVVARGGAGTWAEASLRKAILTGVTYSF